MADNTFGVLFKFSLGLLIITVTFLSGSKYREIHMGSKAGGGILADYEEERGPLILHLPLTFNFYN